MGSPARRWLDLAREDLGVVPLDVVCYTPDEFDEGKDGFLPAIIEREGRRIR